MASTADDFFSLAEEKFDFEVSLSPASSKGDADVEVEDEVFLGPVTSKERCISHGMNRQVKDSMSSGASLGEEPSWSPMLEENFEEICKEAHLLASHIERTAPNPAEVSSSLPEITETFEVDSSAKLGMFCKPVHILSPIKRETFCVQDSPMKQLPPAIQKQLQKVCSVSTVKPRLSTSSPVRTSDTRPKVAPRGKSLLASSRVLPSKPTANSRLSSSNRPAFPSGTRLPPPTKSFGLKRSPGNKNTSIAGSAEDLLSDTASIASDVSDSSFNTSLPVKRGLPVPNKTELRGAPLRKAPVLPNRKVINRSRNTSSSSSSVSSINSSLSVSPGKLNTSLNTSISNISGRVPSSSSRLPGSSRKSGTIAKPLESSTGMKKPASSYGRKGSEPLPRPLKATPIRKAEPGPCVQHQTPAKKNIERTSSVPNISTLPTKTGSTVKHFISKTFVQPTPTNNLRGICRSEVTASPDVPRIMKPKRLISACSMDSVQKLPLPMPHGLQTPSAASEKPVQSKIRRPSALPTPVNRRVSGIPMLTPKSVPRLSRVSHTPEPQSPVSCFGMSPTSPGQLKQTEHKEVVEQVVQKDDVSATVEFQPCSLIFNTENAVDEPTDCEPSAMESPIQESLDNGETSQDKPKIVTPSKLEETLHNHQLSKQEVLLMDVPAPVFKPQEKVLIDLSNTPDLIKTVPNKAFSGQLIDLSSPLIKWSPEGKNESPVNDAPLINLSF